MATAVEDQRAASLLDAQDKAIQLFDEIERDLIRPGISEKELSDAIHELGTKRHGVRTHWHKRVVRSGPNTLKPFAENLTDRIIQPDDILYVDLGPVFEQWEADFGRTYVLGDDPVKTKLRDALEPTWDKVKARFDQNPDITGEELYAIACEEAELAGWQFGAELAGHLIGSFPHERIPRDKISLYVSKGNGDKINSLGKDGHKRHWILEIHLHDKETGIGGFYEKLLTVT
ncbi:Creatinase/aminopeptidase [Thozetella sp. PMI_491]|nr:Creatinase/aminopeptidase [Thozetella sp. PMI_491]